MCAHALPLCCRPHKDRLLLNDFDSDGRLAKAIGEWAKDMLPELKTDATMVVSKTKEKIDETRVS